MHIERVYPDDNFWVAKLKQLFTTAILSELMGEMLLTSGVTASLTLSLTTDPSSWEQDSRKGFSPFKRACKCENNIKKLDS